MLDDHSVTRLWGCMMPINEEFVLYCEIGNYEYRQTVSNESRREKTCLSGL